MRIPSGTLVSVDGKPSVAGRRGQPPERLVLAEHGISVPGQPAHFDRCAPLELPLLGLRGGVVWNGSGFPVREPDLVQHPQPRARAARYPKLPADQLRDGSGLLGSCLDPAPLGTAARQLREPPPGRLVQQGSAARGLPVGQAVGAALHRACQPAVNGRTWPAHLHGYVRDLHVTPSAVCGQQHLPSPAGAQDVDPLFQVPRPDGRQMRPALRNPHPITRPGAAPAVFGRFYGSRVAQGICRSMNLCFGANPARVWS